MDSINVRCRKSGCSGVFEVKKNMGTVEMVCPVCGAMNIINTGERIKGADKNANPFEGSSLKGDRAVTKRNTAKSVKHNKAKAIDEDKNLSDAELYAKYGEEYFKKKNAEPQKAKQSEENSFEGLEDIFDHIFGTNATKDGKKYVMTKDGKFVPKE
ncbi:MAG: hypothetical protein J6M16_09875 [Clostridia bacterium]|nr:hypothetical protein [Clostridia bacterium]